MATKIKLGNGNWGVKDGGTLAYNDENGVFKAIELASSRASGATYVNENGLIADAEVGVPRIDWTNGVGELLLEPESKNLITYSEDFSNTSWNKSIANVTLTSEIAPNGTNDSVYNFVGADANLYTNTQSASLDYTISFYVKSNGNGKDVFKLRLGSDFSQVFTATNEWVRYTFNATPSSQVFGISSNDIDSDILIWGAQLEELSYPTSYIRTEGSQVTRIADAVTGNSSLGQVINSSEGVLYLNLKTLDALGGGFGITLNDGSVNNRVYIGKNTLNSSVFGIISIGGNVVTIGGSNYSDENFIKIALSYKSGLTKLFVNGSQIATTDNTSFSLPNLSDLSFNAGGGAGPLYGRIRELKVYDTALTDAELQNLTTL